MKYSLFWILFISCAFFSCSSKKDEVPSKIRCSNSDFLNKPLEHKQFIENAKCLNWKNNYPELIKVIENASPEQWNYFGKMLNQQFFGKNISHAKDLANEMPTGLTRFMANSYLQKMLQNLVSNDLDVISKVVQTKEIRNALFAEKSIFKIANLLSDQRKAVGEVKYSSQDQEKLKELVLIAIKRLQNSTSAREKTLKMLKVDSKSKFWLPQDNTANLVQSLRTIFEMPKNYPQILERMGRFENILKRNSIACSSYSQQVDIKAQPLMHEQIRIVFSFQKNYEEVAWDLMSLKSQINGFLQICSTNEDLRVLSLLVDDYADLFKNNEIFEIIYNVHQHLGVLGNTEIETFIEFFNSDFYRSFVTVFNTWDSETKNSFVLSLVQLFENLAQSRGGDFILFIENLLRPEGMLQLERFLTDLSPSEWSGIFKTIQVTNSLKSNYFYRWLEKNVANPLQEPLEIVFRDHGEEVGFLLSYFSQQLSQQSLAREDLNRFIEDGAIYDLIGVLSTGASAEKSKTLEENLSLPSKNLEVKVDCSQDFKFIAYGNRFKKEEMVCPWLVDSSLIMTTIKMVRDFEKEKSIADFSLASESSIRLYFSVLLLVKDEMDRFFPKNSDGVVTRFVVRVKKLSRESLQKLNFQKAISFGSSLLESFSLQKNQISEAFTNEKMEQVLAKEKTGQDMLGLIDQWFRSGIMLPHGQRYQLKIGEVFQFVKQASDASTKKEVKIINRDGSKQVKKLTSFERLELLLKNATFLDGYFGTVVVNNLATTTDFMAQIRHCRNLLAGFKLFSPFYAAINPNIEKDISINISNLLELLPVLEELNSYQVAGKRYSYVNFIQSILLILNESSPTETRSSSFIKWKNFDVNKNHKFNKIMNILSGLEWSVFAKIINQTQETDMQNLNSIQNIFTQLISTTELNELVKKLLGSQSILQELEHYQPLLKEVAQNYEKWEIEKFISGLGLDGQKNYTHLNDYLSFLDGNVFKQKLSLAHQLQLKNLLRNLRENVVEK